MIDTHSHLFADEFKNDIAECVNRCLQQGITQVVLVGFSDETNHKAYELSQEYNIFYPTAGVHPSEAKEYLVELDRLREFLASHKVYAIGECGLDYHYGKEDIELQKELFIQQIELSIEMKLPLIIHMRDATEDTYNILKEYKGKITGVMHCYSASLEMAYRFIDLGLYISLGGPVTFKNAKESKRIAMEIPLDKLLIETDCPYLAPAPYRGSRNESSYVRFVANQIAELRGIDVGQLDSITSRNSKNLFKI